MTLYHGSCHCGRVQFEIDTDLKGAGVCNCSICTRRNAVMVRAQADEFRLLQGADDLVEYQFGSRTARHYFCGTCGIYTFHRPRVAPEAYAVNAFCLENLTRAEIDALPVTRYDGRSFPVPDDDR
ncbi:MAG: GFA family protein [Hyphomicrobiales bacterium]|nr:GFA family protein [Hyphomicrobiales bacterium]